MAARNLVSAAELAIRHPERASELGVDQEEIAGWRDAARAVVIPYDDELRVTAQCEGFTRFRRWDFAATEPDEYPFAAALPQLPALQQPGRQAGRPRLRPVCLRRLLRPRAEGARLRLLRADHRPRLVAVGRDPGDRRGRGRPPRPRVRLLRRDRLIDLRDLAFDTRDGVHLASLAGSWLVAVAGFGGMRDHGDTLSFAPCLPSRLSRLLYRRRRLRVDVRPDTATYELLDGDPLSVSHHGEPDTVARGEPQTRPIPSPRRRPPTEPPGRKPPRRHREA